MLLLDEPTSNLTPDEADELFQVLRRLRDERRGVVFVSHKLNEVMALCDRVVVLRQGRVAGERTIAQTSAAELATLMVGREMTSSTRRFPRHMSTHAAPELPNEAAPNEKAPSSDDALENDFTSDVEPRANKNNAVRLSIQGLSCGVLRDFSLQLKSGEIFGLAGVDGNGQAELVEVLSGLRRADSGVFHVLSVDEGAEKNANGAPPRHRAAQRNAALATALAASSIAVITSDRERIGTIGAFDLAENIALAPALRALCGHRLRFDWAGARSITRELMRRFDVRAPSPHGSRRTQRSRRTRAGFEFIGRQAAKTGCGARSGMVARRRCGG